MAETDKKFRSNRQFVWEDDGHRLNVYLNCYMNVAIRIDKFKDYIAAGLESLAAELRAEAAKDRGRFLRAECEAVPIGGPLVPEEEREERATEKLIDQQEKRDERRGE